MTRCKRAEKNKKKDEQKDESAEDKERKIYECENEYCMCKPL